MSWGMLSFKEVTDEVQKESPFGHRPGWSLRQMIVKSGDDCRQEHMALQLIKVFRDIFQACHSPDDVLHPIVPPEKCAGATMQDLFSSALLIARHMLLASDPIQFGVPVFLYSTNHSHFIFHLLSSVRIAVENYLLLCTESRLANLVASFRGDCG